MTYYFTKTLDLSFEEAMGKVADELKKEGFGILTQIDVQETLKKKLDVDFRKYYILGACNPPFAHRALQAERMIGLMLPCNVVMQEVEGERRKYLPWIPWPLCRPFRIRNFCKWPKRFRAN